MGISEEKVSVCLGGLRAQGKFRQWSLGWFGMVGVDWGSLSIGEVEGLMG